jgi:hydrogenase-4 component B
VGSALLLVSIAVFLLAGALAALLSARERLASRIGAGGAVVASAAGMLAPLSAWAGGGPETYRAPWDVPFASFSLGLDPLASFFLVVVCLIVAATAAYGSGYLGGHRVGRRVGASWFHFNVLAASMVVLVSARNGVLFLVAWETMALSSFFLVMYEGQEPGVREAGWKYLVAAHLGSAFVLTFFAFLAASAGTLDFDVIEAKGGALAAAPSVLFLLAVAGFGAKAGFIPLHVWLPEAHPAAPSHVSALMSGAMIKTGIYGLLRSLTFLGPPDPWWGVLLVAIGISSGLLGVLFALAQHDLKRLLAYHSVENIGIIALGIGVGLIGRAAGSPPLVFLGYAGALLHVLNHAVFKGLLFLGAGSVARATGTRDIEQLGGLIKRMPWTGTAFLIGAAAITGLPPLNGFVGEFLIFSGAFSGAGALDPQYAVPLAGVVAALALIGGLAAACFTKAVGVAFLGEPRTEAARRAVEAPRAMVAPMLALALLCGALGLAAPLMVGAVAPAVALVGGVPSGSLDIPTAAAAGALLTFTVAAAVLGGVAGALGLMRFLLLGGRPVASSVTWDCGYAAPGPRMQYTASSFAAPLTTYFRRYLRTRRHTEEPAGLFPTGASLETHTPDVFEESFFGLLFAGTRRALRSVLPLQNGRVQAYVLYIVATLLVLLLFGLV